MSLSFFFGLLGGLLVLAFVANWLARRTGLSDVLVLMATGLLVGPGLHWVDPAAFEGVTRGFGTLALILILFEAGLDLDLRTVRRHFPAGLVLAVVSYGVNLVVLTVVARGTLGLGVHAGLLVAAVLGGVSASVALPVVQTLAVATPLRAVLVVEGAMADILSVLTVSVLLGVPHGGLPLRTLLGGFGREVGISLALGLLAGLVWSYLVARLAEQRYWQVLTLGLVLVLYAVAAHVHGGALLAVLLFGLALRNLPGTRRMLPVSEATVPEPPAALLAFHSDLSFLVRTFFFVLIGMIVELVAFRRQGWVATALFVALLLGRWGSVRLVALLRRGTDALEREVMFWMIPRGLITIVLALEVVRAGGPSWKFLIDLAFALLVLTNLCMTVGTVRCQRLAAARRTAPQPPEAA